MCYVLSIVSLQLHVKKRSYTKAKHSLLFTLFLFAVILKLYRLDIFLILAITFLWQPTRDRINAADCFLLCFVLAVIGLLFLVVLIAGKQKRPYNRAGIWKAITRPQTSQALDQ